MQSRKYANLRIDVDERESTSQQGDYKKVRALVPPAPKKISTKPADYFFHSPEKSCQKEIDQSDIILEQSNEMVYTPAIKTTIPLKINHLFMLSNILGQKSRFFEKYNFS